MNLFTRQLMLVVGLFLIAQTANAQAEIKAETIESRDQAECLNQAGQTSVENEK